MKRIISETPSKWVILKLDTGDYKVFGTWSGGYLDGDRWKLNSGISSIEQDDDFYYFNGFSGSCYKCNKKSYGIAGSYGTMILDRILETAKGRIILMDDVDDWDKLVLKE